MSHEADISISIGIITVSTSRWQRYGDVEGLHALDIIDDESGKTLRDELSKFYRVDDYALVPDDEGKIVDKVLEMLERCEAVILTGGTGLSPRDITIEAVTPLFKKEIPGFGELFRRLSYDEIGYNSILTRAAAGIVEDKVVFCLPGSKNAVKTALPIIVSTLRHIVSHARGLK